MLTYRMSQNAKSQMDDSKKLSLMFGGSEQPRLRKKPVDVLKEKQQALIWIKEQVQLYDTEAMTNDFNNKMAENITRIKKDQENLIKEENRELSRIDKINQLHDQLQKAHDNLEKDKEAMK